MVPGERTTVVSPARLPRVVPGKRAPSFRLKVTLIASLLAAVPLLVVGFVVEDVNEKALGDANEETLNVVSGNVAKLADGVIDRADASLVSIAGVLGDSRRDVETRITVAGKIAATSRTFSEIGIYDQLGTRIDSIVVEGRPQSPPLPDQLSTALATPEQPVFGDVAFAHGEGFILRAVRVEGTAQRWTIAAQLSLAPIAAGVGEFASNLPNKTVFVIDTARRVIADARGERIGMRLTPEGSGMIAGVDGNALGKGVLVLGEFRRADNELMLGEIRTIERTPFAVVVEMSREVAFRSQSAVRRIVLSAVLVAIAIAIIAGIALARRVTEPIRVLVGYADDLANRRFERRAGVKTRDELGVLGDALEAAASELAASDERIRRELAIRSDLGRYLPVKLVDQIVARERDVSLGGVRREITVLFADVVGFTPLAERESAETVVTMLNELFTILTEIVFRHGGTVDKFIGDCVMAVWGAPDEQPDHARRALAAAEDMQRWLDAGNESWLERFGFTVELAIGVNTGEAVVGNFGSETRMEYTAIGDVVNVAARLESIARPNQILVTRSTRMRAGDGFQYRSLGARSLAGKSESVELFEVVA